MENLEPNQTEEIKLVDVEVKKPVDSRTAALKMIALSVLIGSVLISGSIIYVSKSSSSGSKVLGTTTTTPTPTPTPAAGPVEVASRSGEPALGSKDAKVTIIEFADFQCPYCQTFAKTTFSQLKSKYIDTGKVKYVFRHFPLTQIHANAQISSIAAECANLQGKFWEYQDELWKNGKSDGTNLDEPNLKKYADSLGLNSGNKFNQCLDSKATEEAVNSDLAEGSKVGTTGTPTFYINGTKMVGAQPISAFEQAIEAALSK